MNPQDQHRLAKTLLQQGRSDDELERLMGLDLLQIIDLRAAAAAAPSIPSPPYDAPREKSHRFLRA